MTKTTVLCFGGRDFDSPLLVARVLDQLPAMFPEGFAIVQGVARGADRRSGEWATKRGIPNIEVAANWTVYGVKAAGPMRNQWMLDFVRPHYAVSFPGGAGTADMRRRVLEACIPMWTPYG